MDPSTKATNMYAAPHEPQATVAIATPVPDFAQARGEIFDDLLRQQDQTLAQKARESIEIRYLSRNGRPSRTLSGKSWDSTPLYVAKQVALRSQVERWLVARVDGVLWDMTRPLESSCSIEFFDFHDAEGRQAFWTSAAFVLGQAAEQHFGCFLSSAMTTGDGFAIEWGMPAATKTAKFTFLTKADYKPLYKLALRAINKGTPFERIQVGKSELERLFANNKYKLHAIRQLADDALVDVYRVGQLVDMSTTPLVGNAKRLVAFELSKDSSSYFLGDATNDRLQRLYGISFPDKQSFDEHKRWMVEAARRDHRRIGKDQNLFFHDPLAPGSAFFLPHGQVIYNALMNYIREEYWIRGYQEVACPNMFNADLWKQSGHWAHYQDDMFQFKVEKADWALKPMNCPGHCRLFAQGERTYRELPLRIAEFGVLHRNEASGALSGLTRVRRFVQDDAHIFCAEDQVEQEVRDILGWLSDVYKTMFGFSFKIRLSTMPDNHLGDVQTWQRAESQLQSALDGLQATDGVKWTLNPGDGAFYGPKIDIAICDALKREHQCATIQLDFQLPQQFNLEYRTNEKLSQSKIETQGKIDTLSSTTEMTTTPQNAAIISNGDTWAHNTIGYRLQESDRKDSVLSNHDLLPKVTEKLPSIARRTGRPFQTGGDDSNYSSDSESTRSQKSDSRDHSSECRHSSTDQGREDHAPHHDQHHQSGEALERYRAPVSPGYARPVMIHRAILGSFERFIAIILEHLDGKLPFWLSPRQILVIPIAPFTASYAQEVQKRFRKAKMHADVDLSSDTLIKKIRNGQVKKYNFIFIVGQAEISANAVNIRSRDDISTHKRGALVDVERAVQKLQHLRDDRTLSGVVDFNAP